MNISLKMWVLTVLFTMVLQFIFILPPKAYAATTPNLGQAASFGILSSTYTNTAIGTTLNGDLGYTTGPAVAPTVNGTTFSPPSSKYSTAGIDQNSALAALATEPCTFTFAPGAIDLATDTTHGPIGVYTPGVYCTGAASAASIGTGGITLNGSGTYIFRIDGALTTDANSVVTIAGGASSCDVFWTPTAATTLGANSTFAGTVIDASGITIGSTVTWTGRALAFGGTVSTTTDTITSSGCTAATTSSSNVSSSGSSSVAGAKVCPPLSFVAPIILSSRRIDATSIFISWGPYSGIDTFIVQYGMQNGQWLYSTNVTGFSTTISDLPENTPLWVQVAATDTCSIGTYGSSLFVGGPKLPNTGFSPESIMIPWYISAIADFYTFLSSQHLRFFDTTPVSKDFIVSPVRLKIPKIHVDSVIEQVGVTSTGEMGVPQNVAHVGWFDLGPRPGEMGSAVIAGHFNGEDGAAGVFTQLYKLEKGDKVYVKNSDGKSLMFVVQRVLTYDPGYADVVFSPSDSAHLNLITCDGVWNSDQKRYSKRLVVFTDST